MTTTYKFLNDNYEKVENDIKASMYDIVMSEQEKTAAIIGKAQTTSNIKLQEKLIELCNEESECLHNLLEISNLFVENLHKLDSYSRALKKIEDKNIASIITGMRKQRAVDRGQSPVDTAEELEEINKKQEEISKEQEELQEKEIAAQKLIEQVEQEQKASSGPVEQEQQVSNDPIVKSVELVEEVSEEDNTPDELAKTVGIDLQNGDLGSGVMTMDSTSVQGQQTTENAANDKSSKGLELAKSLGINLPSNLGNGVITFNSSVSLNDNNEIVEETKEEKKEEQKEEPPIVEEPPKEEETSSVIIPQISTSNEENENKEEPPQEENSPVIPVITETPIVPTEPPQEENVEPTPVIETTPVVEEPPINLKIYKKNFDEVRAILTSASQIEKLRLSRFSQEALLNSKNFFENVTNNSSPETVSTGLVIPVVNNEQSEQVIPQPEQVIPQVSNGELVIPTGIVSEQPAAPVIPTQPEQPNTLEQQLIDNNLLPNDINSLQAQIDQKMAEAKQLYDAGKTQEAQNMYNEISELSKSLQAQQAEQGVAMAA